MIEDQNDEQAPVENETFHLLFPVQDADFLRGPQVDRFSSPLNQERMQDEPSGFGENSISIREPCCNRGRGGEMDDLPAVKRPGLEMMLLVVQQGGTGQSLEPGERGGFRLVPDDPFRRLPLQI